MERKVYSEIASTLLAWENCRKSDNAEWEEKHEARIIDLVKNHLPSGSGFDNGTKFDFVSSSPDRLVFTTAFHHMDESGGYCGWTDHTVIVTASLAHGYNLRVTGRNKNDIKSYIGEMFGLALDQFASNE